MATSAPSRAGHRLTRQRTQIWDALVALGDAHASVDQIAAAVQERAPEVHRATIYRTLDRLVGEGLVLRTDLGGDRSYYELTSDHTHHHVVCRGCGRVQHVHGSDVAELLARLEAASGYALERADVTVGGRCAECRR